MLLTKNLLIAACCLSTSTQALTWSSPITESSFGEMLPETASTIKDYVMQWAESLADTIDKLSNENTCSSIITGTEEGMKWTWQSGRECDAERHREMLTGAVKEFLSKHENLANCEDCETQCLKMDYGGSLEGWVKLGPIDGFDEEFYCGPLCKLESITESIEDGQEGLAEQKVL
ncbi:hypothetical protein N7457_004423 [Penicillium paradoxum]|uniref:uncharacterized protein n=1 Tax=Penicillium paradoxum TaxID=176176 RepID=UPI00254851F9|nr:uncharacterized protein N7457_004423 [Penicillium paradoxum]KAJ5782649.1 hypothetical protein N7457_004423 [Penicillium paradoxum]